MERGPCINHSDGCPQPATVVYEGFSFCCYQCLYHAFPPPDGQQYMFDKPEADPPPALAVLKPVGDPVHTIRRVPAVNGFAHYIKLDQGTSRDCWMCIDAYGPMSDVGDRLLREDEVQDCPVVYTPGPDDEWARSGGR